MFISGKLYIRVSLYKIQKDCLSLLRVLRLHAIFRHAVSVWVIYFTII